MFCFACCENLIFQLKNEKQLSSSSLDIRFGYRTLSEITALIGTLCIRKNSKCSFFVVVVVVAFIIGLWIVCELLHSEKRGRA
jgi:hypothetical protein